MNASAADVKRPGFLTGLLVGALITAPLIALFFLADVLVGLPLVPYDLMNWTVRVMEGDFLGGLLTMGIDTMVAIIRGLNLGPTDQVAKIAEQSMFVLVLFLGGAFAGGVLFEALKRTKNELMALPLGAAFGGVALGVPLAMINAAPNINLTPETAVEINTLYIITVFMAWGAALGWIFTDMVRLQTAAARQSASVEAIDRRQFLVKLGGATATLTVVGAGLATMLRPGEPEVETIASTVDRAAEAANIPTVQTASRPAALPVAGLQPAPGTRPEYTTPEEHYRIDISARPPRIDGATWSMPITGLVDNPMTLTLDDLQDNYDPVSYIVTIGCISNPIAGDLISTTKWTGVSLQKIIDELGVQEEGKYLLIKSADGFFEYVSIDLIREDERVMLAYAWDDRPLTEDHGYPLRIWIPNRFGMKQPKWIESIEVVSSDEEGYWVRRGWSADALIRATSVIDTIAVNDIFTTGGRSYVPIGGIAWAGTRGVSKVEIQINDGEWQDAALRQPLSDVSWVIWRYDWAFGEGNYLITVRMIEGDGDTRQIEERAGVRPDGATGLHSRQASLPEPEA